MVSPYLYFDIYTYKKNEEIESKLIFLFSLIRTKDISIFNVLAFTLQHYWDV